MKMYQKVCGVATGIILSSAPAFAAITLPTSMDVTNVEGMMTIILAGLAVIWGLRKVIKLTNRS